MRNSKKSSDTLVSIVVPVFNAELFIEEAIKTVRDQTHTNWELLLVDDSSEDKSVELIEEAAKKDGRIKLFKMTENSGAALARNKGIREASGRFIAFLDADDLWTNEKLEEQLAFMQENGHSFIFSDYEFADQYGVSTGKRVNVPSHITYSKALKNPIIWTSTVIIDTQAIPKKSIYMPNIRRGQDAATWWRILRERGNAHGMNTVTAYYRRTSNSLSANKFKAVQRTWYLYRKVEHLNITLSVYNFIWYAYNASRKRI